MQIGPQKRPCRGSAAIHVIFALLLMANIAFFLVMRFMAGQPTDGRSEHVELHADQIKLVAAPQTQGQSSPTQEGVKASPAICVQWGKFAGNELSRAEDALRGLGLEGKFSTSQVEEQNGYWVYIPPLKSKQDATKKIDELKKLGVEDVLLIQGEGKWKYAISLGVFSTEEAANTYLAQIRAKNVKSAKAGARSKDTGEASLILQDVGDSLMAQIVALKQGFPGSEVQAIECKQ
jgi:hypothetical protein